MELEAYVASSFNCHINAEEISKVTIYPQPQYIGQVFEQDVKYVNATFIHNMHRQSHRNSNRNNKLSG